MEEDDGCLGCFDWNITESFVLGPLDQGFACIHGTRTIRPGFHFLYVIDI